MCTENLSTCQKKFNNERKKTRKTAKNCEKGRKWEITGDSGGKKQVKRSEKVKFKFAIKRKGYYNTSIVNDSQSQSKSLS